MLDAEYDSLYSTGKDVLEKRQEKLYQEISIAAIDLTTDSILKADKMKQEEERMKERDKNLKIKEKAINLLNEYEDQLDPRVYQLATEEIENTKINNDDESSDADNSGKTETKKKSSFATRRIVRKRKTDTEE